MTRPRLADVAFVDLSNENAAIRLLVEIVADGLEGLPVGRSPRMFSIAILHN